jgi:hypothetical protein
VCRRDSTDEQLNLTETPQAAPGWATLPSGDSSSGHSLIRLDFVASRHLLRRV